MPDSKEISQLTTAEQTSGSDLFETAIPNAMTESGYVSRKVTANALALLFNNTLQFSSQLQTTSKTLIGAINEIAQGGGGGGASVAMGTTDPSASSGSNGDLYIKYDGTSYEVLAMFVKINDGWQEIETDGGGEIQCGAFVDYTDLIATVTFTNGSASYTATTDCYAIIRGYYVDNTTAIQIKVDGVLERGSSRVGSAIEATTFVATSVLLKKGQTLTVENCLSTTNDNYIKIYGLQYSSPNLQPVIYSEEEREIGVWTNGKPLYEKTVIADNPSSVSVSGYDAYTILNDDYDADILLFINGTLEDSIGRKYALNYDRLYDSHNKIISECYIDENSGNSIVMINVPSGMNITISSVYVTIRYTKTTDTAGSGTWTPQGVPAVHYSTDEQVVGTWVDGSPVYEKTIITNSSVTNEDVDVDISSLNVDLMVSIGGGYSRNVNNLELYYPWGDNEYNTSDVIVFGSYCRFYKTNDSITYKIIHKDNSTTDYQRFTIRYTKSST